MSWMFLAVNIQLFFITLKTENTMPVNKNALIRYKVIDNCRCIIIFSLIINSLRLKR